MLNQVHLLGYATPLIIGYMMVCFRRGTSRVALLIWGFITGFLFDTFSDTAGMASASCTLIAMIQAPQLNSLAPRDASEDFTPCFRAMGFWKYFLFVFIMMLVLHSAFYLLDAFTLANWQLTLMAIGIGTLLSTVLVIFIELLVRSRKV